MKFVPTKEAIEKRGGTALVTMLIAIMGFIQNYNDNKSRERTDLFKRDVISKLDSLNTHITVMQNYIQIHTFKELETHNH